MKHEYGDWTLYRTKFSLTKYDEVDLHFGHRDLSLSYEEAMAKVASIVEGELRARQAQGRPYVMFIHGWSTSRPGKQTARSVVRQFMRSKEATPLIERSQCIMHETVFLAKVRPKPSTGASP
jgi:hypothetical protein